MESQSIAILILYDNNRRKWDDLSFLIDQKSESSQRDEIGYSRSIRYYYAISNESKCFFIDCDSSRDSYASVQPPQISYHHAELLLLTLQSTYESIIFSILPFSPSQVHSSFGCPPSSIHAEHLHSIFSILLRPSYTRGGWVHAEFFSLHFFFFSHM